MMLRSALVVLSALAVLMLSPVSGSSANGVPQLVKLTYLEGVSNWGPADGEGVLEFSFSEATARVDVKDLFPQEGFSYEGWMTGPDEAALFVGNIEVGEDGIGGLNVRLDGYIDSVALDTFVVAGRETTSEDRTLPETISIAGRFNVLDDEPDGDTSTEIRPRTLPYTGEKPPAGPLSTYWPTAAAVGAAAVIVGIVARMRSRKEAHQ
jgi:hypothetical protein